MKYRPEIDGLRAIAVLPVVFFHAGISVFRGGYVGVDVFFVISGYLITSIILSELDQDKFSIINFYERRIRRIMPMLFFIIIFSSFLSWQIFFPSDMKAFSKSVTAVALFASNILFWSESGYWDISSELKPLLHTWSLAVEEQFYIAFPLMLSLLHKLRKKWTILIIGMGTIGSFAIAEYGSFHYESAGFFLLPSRAWELFIGAICAVVINKYPLFYEKVISRKNRNEVLSLLGLSLILCATFYFDDSTPFPSRYTLVPTLGTALVIMFASTDTYVRRILSEKVLVRVGLLSYSIYLVHQPIFAFIRYSQFGELSYLTVLCAIVGIYVMSYLCWRFIEAPFRKKELIGKKSIFRWALIMSVVAIIFGVVGNATEGFENRKIVEDLSIRDYEPDNDGLKRESWSLLRERTGDDSYFVESNEKDELPWFSEDDRYKLLIVGNSHSKDMYNVLNHSKGVQSRFELARYGLQVRDLIDPSHSLYHSINYQDADVIMLASRYSSDLEFEEIMDHLIRDNKIVVVVKRVFEFSFYGNKTLADFRLQQFIKAEEDTVEIRNFISRLNKEYFEEFREREKDLVNEEIRESFAGSEDIIVLDRMDYICDEKNEKCYSIDDQLNKYFYDYGHHTMDGAEFFGKRIDDQEWFKPVFERVESIKKN